MSGDDVLGRPAAVLLDLLTGVMDSLSVWTAAAGSRAAALAWRDAVTSEMVASTRYVEYEALLARGAAATNLPARAVDELLVAWQAMEPWPDALHVRGIKAPYAFVTNCSSALADLAARRTGLRPRFVLSAEEAGFYKPSPEVYRLACQRIGAAPREVVFAAGSAYDAAGARDAGLRSVLIRRRRDQEVPDGVRPFRSMKDLVERVGTG